MNQELRKDHEQDRRRDSDYKERNNEPRRSLGPRVYGYDSDRSRADHVEVDARRPQAGRYDVEESARAAAEYKKELEERRRQTSRTLLDKADPTKDRSKKDADTGGPRTPKTRITELQQHTANHDSINRSSNSKTGEIGTISSTRESRDDLPADVRDWLEMTGFSDPTYRTTALTRFRKIKALDLQKAELEREAQLEIEARAHIARAQSALPRESIEANITHSSVSPTIIRTSISSMPPPPIPTKNAVDDIGIKIKDSANRDGLPNRPVNDDVCTTKRGYDHNKTRSPTLKRSHGDDELDSRSGRVVEKISRVDTSGHGNDLQANSSPVTSRGHWSLDNRTSRHEGPHERVRSRSPESRNRSASPIRGRTSTYDKYVPRQRSRSPARRNGYSPDRQLNFNRSAISERPKYDSLWCWNCQQSGHHSKECKTTKKRHDNEIKDESYEDSRNTPFDNKRSEVLTENDQARHYVGDYQASTIRSSVGPYQNHHLVNYRGRGRGRGGFQYANNRGGYKSYRPEGTQEVQFSGGSASLNLRAGGQSL